MRKPVTNSQRKTLLIAATLVSGLLLTVTACSGASAGGDPEPAASINGGGEPGDIVGVWRMTSLATSAGEGAENVPYSGQIIFSDAGTMSVQAMNPDEMAPDTPYTLGGYEAYYGPVDIDTEAGRFEIRVESAAVRALIGRELARNYEVTDDDLLVLTPIDPAEGWRATYEREEERS